MYSQEDIERKRLQALERKNQRDSFDNVNKKDIQTSKNVAKNQPVQNNAINSINRFSNQFTSNYKNKNFASNCNKYSTRESYGGKSQSVLKLKSTKNRYNPVANTSTFYGVQQTKEVQCFILSENRFMVEMSVFDNTLVDLFKTIPTRLYNAQNRTWNFHISDYKTLNEKIVRLKSDIVFKGLPNFLIKTLIDKQSENKQSQGVDLSNIDAVLLNSLYPFQKEGVEYGIAMNGKCLIADDMGLGKTKEALGIAAYYKKDWPLIIVTPSSLKYQWLENVIENIPSVPIQSIQHIVNTKDFIEKSKIIIISYDLLIKKIDSIAALKYGVVICDESHYLKSGKTQRAKAVQKLLTKCKRIIFLTGTPALSRPIELYFQIKLLLPSFMSYQDFGIRYCGGVKRSFGWDFKGSTNSKELEILLKACCLIRRLKSDVMFQLPSKIRENIILDPHLIKHSTKEMEEACTKVEKSLNSIQKKNALLEYYSATSKVKEKAVCNYISDLIENQEKFLIFAHHQNMLDAICNLLTSKKILFIRIDGKTNTNSRKTFVDTFQQDDKVLVAVLSILAANAGITMTAARLVIFAELSWNPGILAQAEDRVHRIGQTSNVVIRYLLAKCTADDHMWPAIQQKINVLNQVGLDQNFDIQEVEELNKSSVPSNQETLDNYFEGSPSKKSMNSLKLDQTGNTALHTSSDSLKDLLEVDDDAFNDINLDGIF